MAGNNEQGYLDLTQDQDKEFDLGIEVPNFELPTFDLEL